MLSLSMLSSIVLAEKSGDIFIVEKSPLIAFTHARVIDGTGSSAKAKQTVLVRNGRIINIGRDGAVDIPKGAKIISLKGKSLLPGWVMTHEHLFYITRPLGTKDESYVSGRIFTEQPISFPRLYLSAGVTSARTAGAEAAYTDLRIKEQIDSGVNPGPDFDLTAPIMYKVTGPDEARERVRFWAGQGLTSIKVYAEINRAQLAAAVDEAHKQGLKVLGHLCAVTYREAVDLGIDHIEHGFAGLLSTDLNPNKPLDTCTTYSDGKVGGGYRGLPDLSALSASNPKVKSLFQHIIDNNVFVTTEPVVAERAALPENIQAFYNEAGLRDYKSYRAWKDGKVDGKKRQNQFLNKLMAMNEVFWRMGGKLTVGSDAAGTGVMPGHGNLRSIEMLAESGIPLLEVIKIATHNGAESMGILDDRGTIEVGKRADLLVINGDPSKDISAIQKIETVFKNGIGYDPAALKKSTIGTVGGPG